MLDTPRFSGLFWDMPRVLVTRPVPDSALDLLRPHAELEILEGDEAHPLPSEPELIAAAAPSEIFFTLPAHPITAKVIAAAPKLRSCMRRRATVGWPARACQKRTATTIARSVQWQTNAIT